MPSTLSPRVVAASFLALCAIGTRAAETTPPPAAAPSSDMMHEHCRKDPTGCREHGRARFEERFKRLDRDGDGAVSKAEAEQGAPHLARNFAAIDANQDGKLTPAEVRTAARARMEKCKQDPQSCRAQAMQRFEADWKHADADGDGALSRAEAGNNMPGLARHFDKVDANKDGKITPEEAQAARARHHYPHRLPKPDAPPPAAPNANS
jgi:Ca2+-binding EF-hand superfamily protein